MDHDESGAIAALPKLLPAPLDRERAIGVVEEIAGDKAEMSEATLHMLVRLRKTLSLPPVQLGAALMPIFPAEMDALVAE